MRVRTHLLPGVPAGNHTALPTRNHRAVHAVSSQQKDSLDHEVLWPILNRVARGTITVRRDDYGYSWYYDGDRHCLFVGYLLEKLTEQGYTRWDRHS